MDAKSLLRNPDVEMSAAWKAATFIWGPEVQAWEPDTFRIELERRGVTASNSLMAKLLAAQTIITTNRWLLDHVVFFAVALACDGVSPVPGLPQHPTPEQLCWAVDECHHLVKMPDLHDEGFDPDEVDPAICCVLIEDGFHVAPSQLAFVDGVMEKLTHRDEKDAPYKDLVFLRDTAFTGNLPDLIATVKAHEDTAAGVQLARLLDCRSFVEERARKRAIQYGDATR